MTTSTSAALISAAGTVAVALIGALVELLRRQHRVMGEVRDQVSNTHTTNLRDDVDRVITGLGQVLEGQAQHSREMAGIRDDLAHERAERLAVAERLDRHVSATSDHH
ncbi:DUF2746 domain-containing protein [Streptomyces venezuelae]|uniref:DUF2746 domain-containing protein n=1 Tax=Streptomyces venezuelae TaxID=54571 RepID=A0A5P2BLE8_STRVZ|nr:DUF2746 domain-containing protein [Streptomyces venezuelae]QES29179.1 hypothetical protein DEJ47_24540 [Streptomyces venezuelae]